MDIVLNDGTVAKNVTVWEYEQLKEKGYVGRQNITWSSNVCDGTVDLSKTIGAFHVDPPLSSVAENYSKCWMCGCKLDDTNRANIAFASYPPKYACKTCVGEH